MSSETVSGSQVDERRTEPPVPGVVLVFSGQRAQFRPIPLPRGSALVVGREDVGGVAVPDERMSRRHLELFWRDGTFEARDLGSRNGSGLDGAPLLEKRVVPSGSVLRAAQSLFVVADDVRPFLAGQVEVGDAVIGPTVRAALDQAALARRAGGHLLIRGESGVGKELVARHYWAASPVRGEFLAVNCAAVPATMAERLFLGAVRGAYSDAKSDQKGYFAAAAGGALFLDEIVELDLQVQAKLLRVVETGEVLPLGATTPQRVDLRLVAASQRDLREAVARGAFRADLLYRLMQFSVEVPPLRERKEDIPWLLERALGTAGVGLHVSAVETAMLRAWPGNVRELLAATGEALARARSQGAAQLRGEHFGDAPGRVLEASGGEAADAVEASGGPPEAVTRERVEAALAQEDGNVAAAARALGVHRTQLYRLMKRFGVS